MADPIDNPILNSPYDPPARYFAIGPNGPTGEINEGRRPSESFINRLGCGVESVRGWVGRADIDDGYPAGVSATGVQRI